MRIIFLNTWNGKTKQKLLDFIVEEAKTTDIFCLQEVKRKLFRDASDLLPGFSSFKFNKPYVNGWIFNQVIFIKNNIQIKNIANDFLITGAGQAACIKYKDKEILICNIHGVSLPYDKVDTGERLEDSRAILKFVESKKLPTIIGGDFNSLPDNKNIGIIESAGFVNLIKNFKIKSTRNRLAWDFHKTAPNFVKQYFADYCFVSPEINVASFEVPNIEISDHLPLILDFD